MNELHLFQTSKEHKHEQTFLQTDLPMLTAQWSSPIWNVHRVKLVM